MLYILSYILDSMLITLKYNRDKYLALIESKEKASTATKIEDTNGITTTPITRTRSASSVNISTTTPKPTKIVTFRYNSSIYKSPLTSRLSQRRTRNRTPTPQNSLGTTTGEINFSSSIPNTSAGTSLNSSPIKQLQLPETPSYIEEEGEEEVKQEVIEREEDEEENLFSPFGIPLPSKTKDSEDALNFMYKYNELYHIHNNKDVEANDKISAIEHNQAVENVWFDSLNIVADRLHFLREAYKAIQLVKKKKLTGKFDVLLPVSSPIASTRVIGSDMPSSPKSSNMDLNDLYSMRIESGKRLLEGYDEEEEDGAMEEDEESESSHTDTSMAMMARRQTRSKTSI